jgi:hypothetical protein
MPQRTTRLGSRRGISLFGLTMENRQIFANALNGYYPQGKIMPVEALAPVHGAPTLVLGRASREGELQAS